MKFSKDKKKREIEKRIWVMLIRIAKLKARNGLCELCKVKRADQTDHCFSSMVARLRFEHQNLTRLCGGCHTMKTFGTKGADIRVHRLVFEREGKDWFDYAVEVSKDLKSFQWTIPLLEQKEIEVRETLQAFDANLMERLQEQG